MTRTRDRLLRIGFFALVSLSYAAIFCLLSHAGLYRIEAAHNDRLFSADDVYYVNHFFSTRMDTSLRIIKHPLLIPLGWLMTTLEHALFGALSVERHYQCIVLGQLLCSLAALYVLERILRTQYGLKTPQTLLLCGIYALSFSVLFFAFVAESYALSALLLLLSFYTARKGAFIRTYILGALAAGVTVTNGVLWAAIVLLSGGKWKGRLLTLLCGTALFFLLVAALPVREVFFRNLLSGGLNSAHSYSDHFGFFPALRYVFFAFFGSTGFYLHTQEQSPFGDFAGDALSFLPEASFPILLAAALFLGLLVWAVLAARKDRLLYAPLAVLALNLLLHGVLQYGLKEAFLYSLHHYAAQLLILAQLLRRERTKRPAMWLLRGYGICLIVLNLPGYAALLQFLRR